MGPSSCSRSADIRKQLDVDLQAHEQRQVRVDLDAQVQVPALLRGVHHVLVEEVLHPEHLGEEVLFSLLKGVVRR